MQNQLFNFGFFSNFQSRYRFLIKLIFLVTATFLCGSLDTPAQKIRKDKRSTAKIVAGKVLPKLPNAEITGNDVKVPISIVNQSEADYLSGEASVAVNPKQPTVVRLGLAQNAVSVVEFPASDGVYYIHEGNPKLVSVFQSPTKESDRSITIYPGESFVVGQKEASATITLQMRSGLILILEFVPVAGIRHNAHRCVISYNREEVISARRAAGLAFNLGEEIKPQINKNTRANSKLVGITSEEEGENKQTEESQKTAEIIPVKLTQTDVNRGRISRQADEKSNKQPKIG
ncbi:MAG TPA: hypothetical protein PKY82_07315, partial [Pyrinomonadaceae bacterium]|nr:hypothetical protein [Pyrinomonadaceae bacterium]